MKTTRTMRKNRGAALMLVVLFMVVISLVITEGFISPILRSYDNTQKTVKSSTAYYLAEAGVEDVYYRLKNDMDISATEYIELDGATTTVTITMPAANERQIISDADVDSYFRTVQIDVTSSVTDIEFGYAAQIGKGGIDMGENAEVRGAAGGVAVVHANGPITGDTGSKVYGDLFVSSGVSVDQTASSTACDADQDVVHNPYVDVAQSFVASESEILSKVSLYLKRIGLPTNKTVRIIQDSSGSPGTVTLASADLTKNMGGTTYGWVDISFNSPVTLTSGTTYWIVIDGVNNKFKYWHWCSDSTASYSAGESKYTADYTSGSWTSLPGDLAFKIGYGEGLSVIDNVEVTQIARANSIQNGSFIWGDAYYETISASTVLGTSYPGSPTPGSVPLPVTDTMITDWTTDAALGGTITGDCPGAVGCSWTLGPQKVDGDFTLENGETLTLTGILHITGDFHISNNSTVECTASFGPRSCIVLVDGTVEPVNNGFFAGSGTTGSYVVVVSTVEGCNGGAQQPQCLPNNSSIYIANNVGGGLFYSTSGLIYLDNNADIVSAIGYMLQIDNNGYITYEDEAANTSVSSGSDAGWQMNEWSEIE